MTLNAPVFLTEVWDSEDDNGNKDYVYELDENYKKEVK
jgi:hypothetical protein